MKKVFIVLVLIFVVLFIIGIIVLATNKTFFKTTYIGVNNQEIFIPKYSFFDNESGMTVASFKSLRSKKELDEEIANYMKDFEYFDNSEDESSNEDVLTYGYKKGNLFIQSYQVIDEGLFRRIYIVYWLKVEE